MASPRRAGAAKERHLSVPVPAAAVGPTFGLALGGGGARGFAHVLMLEALDELGIAPKVIAGTSIGALIG
ncbi:MAG TPA: patatin-like phospholipase family protein, partial [Dongiaceae bacterium]